MPWVWTMIWISDGSIGVYAHIQGLPCGRGLSLENNLSGLRRQKCRRKGWKRGLIEKHILWTAWIVLQSASSIDLLESSKHKLRWSDFFQEMSMNHRKMELYWLDGTIQFYIFSVFRRGREVAKISIQFHWFVHIGTWPEIQRRSCSEERKG